MVSSRTQTTERDEEGLTPRRTDLDFALHNGITPAFSYTRMPDIYASLPPQYSLHTTLPSGIDGLGRELGHVLTDTMAICTLYNDPSLTFRLDPHAFHALVVALGHRLLHIHTLGAPPLTSPLERAVHIGLVTFVTTLMLQFGRRRYLEFKLVKKRLRETVEGLDEKDGGVRLWLLFMGGVAVEGGGRAWYRDRIGALGMKEWADVRAVLGRYPWIGAIHDEGGHGLLSA